MFILLKRIIKMGWKNFFRNFSLNIATIFIMVVVICLVTLFFLLNPIFKILISDIQEKVDVSIYFKEDTLPEEIFKLKAEISKIPEVKNIDYVSSEQIFNKFKEKYKRDPVLIESLTELGYNPFLPSLNIKVYQASQYGQIVKLLEMNSYKDLIEKVDYYERKPVIEKIFSTINGVNKAIVFLGIIFGIISILIVFNTIRIAIYNSGEEISIMRLIGASNWFIRGPFLVQGFIIGIIASLITFLIFFGICYGFDSKVKSIFYEVSLFNIFLTNMLNLVLLQLLIGIGLGVCSSYIAIRRYLKT